VHYVTKLQKPV